MLSSDTEYDSDLLSDAFNTQEHKAKSRMMAPLRTPQNKQQLITECLKPQLRDVSPLYGWGFAIILDWLSLVTMLACQFYPFPYWQLKTQNHNCTNGVKKINVNVWDPDCYEMLYLYISFFRKFGDNALKLWGAVVA